ncbi:hypothetical protein HDU98_007027 [Podochytrium sp. JEL0797]|nr:hypothetical protein HDU98_007027 [Podochytrium sp. JEL0797]
MRPMADRMRVSIAMDVAKAMAYLHSRGIIHRDLKSENLLVTENKRIKVCDFGFSRPTPTNVQETRRLSYCGTDSYMAPEIILCMPFDHRIDIFSYGIILCELAMEKIADMTVLTRAIPGFGINQDEIVDGVCERLGLCDLEVGIDSEEDTGASETHKDVGSVMKGFLEIAFGCANEEASARLEWKFVMRKLKGLEGEINKVEKELDGSMVNSISIPSIFSLVNSISASAGLNMSANSSRIAPEKPLATTLDAISEGENAEEKTEEKPEESLNQIIFSRIGDNDPQVLQELREMLKQNIEVPDEDEPVGTGIWAQEIVEQDLDENFSEMTEEELAAALARIDLDDLCWELARSVITEAKDEMKADKESQLKDPDNQEVVPSQSASKTVSKPTSATVQSHVASKAASKTASQMLLSKDETVAEQYDAATAVSNHVSNITTKLSSQRQSASNLADSAAVTNHEDIANETDDIKEVNVGANANMEHVEVIQQITTSNPQSKTASKPASKTASSSSRANLDELKDHHQNKEFENAEEVATENPVKDVENETVERQFVNEVDKGVETPETQDAQKQSSAQSRVASKQLSAHASNRDVVQEAVGSTKPPSVQASRQASKREIAEVGSKQQSAYVSKIHLNADSARSKTGSAQDFTAHPVHTNASDSSERPTETSEDIASRELHQQALRSSSKPTSFANSIKGSVARLLHEEGIQSASKPTSNPVSKPSSKPASKPVSKPASKQLSKTVSQSGVEAVHNESAIGDGEEVPHAIPQQRPESKQSSRPASVRGSAVMSKKGSIGKLLSEEGVTRGASKPQSKEASPSGSRATLKNHGEVASEEKAHEEYNHDNIVAPHDSVQQQSSKPVSIRGSVTIGSVAKLLNEEVKEQSKPQSKVASQFGSKATINHATHEEFDHNEQRSSKPASAHGSAAKLLSDEVHASSKSQLKSASQVGSRATVDNYAEHEDFEAPPPEPIQQESSNSAGVEQSKAASQSESRATLNNQVEEVAGEEAAHDEYNYDDFEAAHETSVQQQPSKPVSVRGSVTFSTKGSVAKLLEEEVGRGGSKPQSKAASQNDSRATLNNHGEAAPQEMPHEEYNYDDFEAAHETNAQQQSSKPVSVRGSMTVSTKGSVAKPLEEEVGRSKSQSKAASQSGSRATLNNHGGAAPEEASHEEYNYDDFEASHEAVQQPSSSKPASVRGSVAKLLANSTSSAKASRSSIHNRESNHEEQPHNEYNFDDFEDHLDDATTAVAPAAVTSKSGSSAKIASSKSQSHVSSKLVSRQASKSSSQTGSRHNVVDNNGDEYNFDDFEYSEKAKSMSIRALDAEEMPQQEAAATTEPVATQEGNEYDENDFSYMDSSIPAHIVAGSLAQVSSASASTKSLKSAKGGSSVKNLSVSSKPGSKSKLASQSAGLDLYEEGPAVEERVFKRPQSSKPKKVQAIEYKEYQPPTVSPQRGPEINYVGLVANLRHEITTLRKEMGIRDDAIVGLKEREHDLKAYADASKAKGKDSIDKNTRILLDRQKKAYQILVAKLRREVRRLNFQKNSLSDPLIESKYFPYLPRTPYGSSSRTPPIGIIGNLPQRSSDYFPLNPPPPTGNHIESGNRWWWGSGPDLSSHS